MTKRSKRQVIKKRNGSFLPLLSRLQDIPRLRPPKLPFSFKYRLKRLQVCEKFDFSADLAGFRPEDLPFSEKSIGVDMVSGMDQYRTLQERMNRCATRAFDLLLYLLFFESTIFLYFCVCTIFPISVYALFFSLLVKEEVWHLICMFASVGIKEKVCGLKHVIFAEGASIVRWDIIYYLKIKRVEEDTCSAVALVY